MVRLEVDINFTDMEPISSEKTIYFETEKANAHLFTDDSYDGFVLIPLWLAMLYKQDLHIHGNISKKLYHNIKWYIQKILCDFSDALVPVKITVDGFTSPLKERGKIIGASMSCGIDSLSTIYDHYINEKDPDYRINALFMFNCGTHGRYENPATERLFRSRCHRNLEAAKALHLPAYVVTSNMAAFVYKIYKSDQKSVYFAMYSCVLGMQNEISRYYVSSNFSYEEIKEFRNYAHELDIAEFSESYIIPLIQTDNLEMIIDGCQYRRVDKLKNIVDWDIAKKYLNICISHLPDASNCGYCWKCLQALFELEVLGKQEEFLEVFSLKALAEYNKRAEQYKLECLKQYNVNPFRKQVVDFARENNYPMPTLEKK